LLATHSMCARIEQKRGAMRACVIARLAPPGYSEAMIARPLAVAVVSLLVVGVLVAEPARAAFGARVAHPEVHLSPAPPQNPSSAPSVVFGSGVLLAVAAPDQDLPNTPVAEVVPTPTHVPRRRTSVAPRLDLQDPWGKGTLAAPVSSPKAAAIDLVDPWDPSRAFVSPEARAEVLLDPWTP